MRPSQRFSALVLGAALISAVALSFTEQLQDDDGNPWELWPGPDSAAAFPAWYANWTAWAVATRAQANLTGDIFTVEELMWTQVIAECGML